MKLLYAILAGLAATAAMTAFLYLLSYATNHVMKVIKILGTMLLSRTQRDGSLSDAVGTKVVGTIANYLVGILYAIAYLALWESGVGMVTASWGLLLGVANGLFAMIIWYFFFMIHPMPPAISLRVYLITLIFAHIVFGLVVTYTYYLLSHPEYLFWQ